MFYRRYNKLEHVQSVHLTLNSHIEHGLYNITRYSLCKITAYFKFWFNSTKYCLNKLRVSYNNSCRRLLGLPMRNSASGMFVQCNLLSFGELLRKSIYAFRGRIQSSDNTIIKCMVNSVAPLVSNVWKWWRTTLYTGHVTV